MRTVAAVSAALLGLVGCDNGKMHAHPPDAPPGPRWWKPTPGEARNWDLQVQAPFDLAPARAMVAVDLWALVPQALTLDYGDGDPVAVPAGALAGSIVELHARDPETVVICHVATGAVRDTDPDARKFPAASQGNTTGSADQRYLDIRTAGRAAWAPAMWKRLALARQIGCDGVMPDKNDMVQFDAGWTLTPEEQTSWYAEVASQAHDRDLSVGLVNGQTVPGLYEDLVGDFDWLVIERCAEFDDCGATRPFLNQRKAVFAIDYTTDIDGATLNPTSLCEAQEVAMIQDGLVKDTTLSSATRTQCLP